MLSAVMEDLCENVDPSWDHFEKYVQSYDLPQEELNSVIGPVKKGHPSVEASFAELIRIRMTEQQSYHHVFERKRKPDNAYGWLEDRRTLGAKMMGCNRAPHNRAALKLKEIFSELSKSCGVVLNPGTGIVDLAGAPGAWAHWLCHQSWVGWVMGYSITEGQCGAYHQQLAKHCPNFTDVSVVASDADTVPGDLLSSANCRNLVHTLKGAKGGAAPDWVVADAGINISPEQYEEKPQAIWVNELTTATVRVATQVVAVKGNIIVKTFGCQHYKHWVRVVGALKKVFRRVLYIKPVTSSPTSDECYLIGLYKNTEVIPPQLQHCDDRPNFVEHLPTFGWRFTLTQVIMNILHLRARVKTYMVDHPNRVAFLRRMGWCDYITPKNISVIWRAIFTSRVGKHYGPRTRFVVPTCAFIEYVLPATKTRRGLKWDEVTQRWWEHNERICNDMTPTTLCVLLKSYNGVLLNIGYISKIDLWARNQWPNWQVEMSTFCVDQQRPQQITTEIIHRPSHQLPVVIHTYKKGRNPNS